jgi:PAS domain S-box-containing protein
MRLLKKRVRQQAAVADLGRRALAEPGLDILMNEAVTLLVDTLDIEYAKILELQPDGSEMLLRAGVGWSANLVGQVTVGAGLDSQAGYTLAADQPIIVDDLRTETRFSGPPLLHEHGVVSSASVIIRGHPRPYGVLGVHTRERRAFTPDDVLFLRAVANIIALAVQREADRVELYRREQAFKTLSENALDIIARFDRKFRHLYVNRVIEEITGLPAEEFIGKTNRELGMPDELVTQWEQALRSVLDSGEHRWVEFEFSAPDGTRWFQSRLSPEFGSDGTAETVLGITREVTAQRVAVEQLRRNEEQFRSLSVSSPVGIFVSDVEGNVTYLNPRCEEILDVPLSAALGQGWLSLIPEDDRAMLYKKMGRAFDVGRTGEAEVRIKKAPDTDRWIMVRVAPVRGIGGEFTGYVGTLEDITEKKFAERRLSFLAEASAVLSESLDVRKTMEAIVNLAIPRFADMSMVHLVDNEGELRNIAVAHVDPEIEANLQRRYREEPPRYEEPHSIARVLRTQRAELIREISDQRWQEITHTPEHRDLVLMFQPRSALSVPLVARNIVLGVMTFVYSSSGRRYTEPDLELGISLGYRAALAIDNARLYQEAQDAIRYRDEFLSIASHELKTPLTSVKGYTQLLELLTGRPDVEPERMAAAAARAREQAERLEALITDLLDVSRIHQGRLDLRLSEFDLAELAATVLRRFEEGPEITPLHRLELVAPEPVVGEWDSERLDQVLTNLISNAVKYSPQGGPVRVEVRVDGSTAELAVSDQGIGIPESELGDVFEPFQRTHRVPASVTGTGLGLFIVRRIVEQHGGSISVESEIENGSRFVVRLPRDMSNVLARSAAQEDLGITG